MNIVWRQVVLSAIVALFVFGPATARAGITRAYELNNSFADSVNPLNPQLTSLGGSLQPGGGYSFAANQGLTVNPGVTNVYSIETVFRLQNVGNLLDPSDSSGYRKILDFKNGNQDYGLYVINTCLRFFLNDEIPPDFNDTNDPTGPLGGVLPNTQHHLVLTRDASGLVQAYLDGVAQFTGDQPTEPFMDTAGRAVFANEARFFVDDSITAGAEASGGSARFIRVYDMALTQSQVNTLFAATVPAPGAAVLLFSGAGAWGLWRGGRRILRRRS